MPTSARLAGAVLLAALGAYAAMLAKPHLPEGEPGGMLIPMAAIMGVLVGWIFTGRQLDRGQGQAAAIGFGSAVLLVFWVTFLFAMEEMVDRSMRNSYGGSPTKAVQDVFNIMLDYTEVMQLDVLIVLGVGGVLVGVLTGFVGRYFR